MNSKMFLALEDGTIYEGESFGMRKTVTSQLVFDTSMVGYMEILTDPRYYSQAVISTFGISGNYGICKEDVISNYGPSVFVCKEWCRKPSNFRSEGDIDTFLLDRGIVGICGIDTRALTKKLSDQGTMNCMVTPDKSSIDFEMIKNFRIHDAQQAISTNQCYSYNNGGKKLAVLDYGLDKRMLDNLTKLNYSLKIYPYSTQASTIINDKPDGIILSSGAECFNDIDKLAQEVKVLADSNLPIMAIGFGHLVLAKSQGMEIKPLLFGHRGCNQPVQNATNAKVLISSQNHGYCVDSDSVNPDIAKISYYHLNDKSLEGLIYNNGRMFGVQFDLNNFEMDCSKAFLAKVNE